MDKILAVDLCNTLYKSNTTQDFFEFTFKEKDSYKKFKSKNDAFSFRILNKLSNKYLKKDISKKIITKLLEGMDKEDINNAVKKFIDDFLADKRIVKAEELIKEYKDKGYYVVMISASYDFIADEIARRLSVDKVIASTAEIINNKFTGIVKEDILYNKLDKFNKEFKDYSDLIMITDNETDYDFVKNTSKSYIIIHNKNKEFWIKRKNERLTFIEE